MTARTYFDRLSTNGILLLLSLDMAMVPPTSNGLLDWS